MAAPSPKEIAAALDGQAKKIEKLEAKNQALEDEVRPLRANTKTLQEVTAKLEAAERAAEVAAEKAQAAEVRANQLQAELAAEQAARARFESIADAVAERDEASALIEKHLAGRS